MPVNYSLKIFTLHLFIALTYLGITSYKFVIEKYPNPIGIGLQQWLFIALHLFITITIMAFLWVRDANKRAGRNKFMLNVSAIGLWIGIMLVFSNAIWSWLWDLR